MVGLKFVCDRMLKRLAKWLRLSGYDTVCEEAFNTTPEKEDTYLVENFKDRILLTKDRELYHRRISRGYPAKLITSNQVWKQMKEVMELGVKFYPVTKRCTLCNSNLRKLKEEEAKEILEKMGLGKDLLKKELWFCENCKKVYWIGSHWKNMIKFLEEHGLI